MDSTDIKILDYLQTDATMTAKELAAKLSLSPTPVYDRIRKLEKAGIIKGYVALLDAELLNQGLVVIMNLAMKDHHNDARKKLIQKLLGFVEIIELYHTSGAFDFVVKSRFNDIKQYKDFLVNRVSSLENIANIESQIVLEELKYVTTINLKGEAEKLKR